jgi:hypothetical protein
MYNAISFILFIVYKLYNRRRDKKIAYEAAILLFLSIIFFNIFTLLLICNSTKLLPFNPMESNWLLFLEVGGFYILPGYIIMSLLFRKKHIISLQYDEEKIFWGKMIIVLYYIVSFLTPLIIAIYKASTI